jgi:adenosine/AMP kinase
VNIASFWAALQSGSSYLLTLLAGTRDSIHSIETSHPAVGLAVAMVEAEVPGFSAIEGIGTTLLATAQSTVQSISAGVADAAIQAKAAEAKSAAVP